MSWNANDETDVVGYNIYRSSNNSTAFQLIAEKINTVVYVDTTAQNDMTYYYKISAVDAEDISYFSEQVVTGDVVFQIPRLIQAENWSIMSGFELEDTTDIGGGTNTSFADTGDWLEYSVFVSQTASYLVEYRLASQNGSEGFTLSIDGDVADTVLVSATGGWQSWDTQITTIKLTKGEHIIRIESLDRDWNLNWIRLSIAPE